MLIIVMSRDDLATKSEPVLVVARKRSVHAPENVSPS